MIRAKRYFQASFLLPLILPLPFILVASRGFGGLGGIALVLEGSLLIGGIPYILFLAGLSFWARGKNFRTLQRMTYIAPLLFIAVFVYCALLLIPVQILTVGEVRVEGRAVSYLCVFILILGYFYVLLANLGFHLLKATGHIDEEAYWEGTLPSPAVTFGRKRYILAFILALPLLLIPVSFLIRRVEQKDYPKRIAEANRIEVSVNRDSALIHIAFEQAQARRYEEARATVMSYVVDKDSGYASIVTAQVYGGAYEEAKTTANLIASIDPKIMALSQIAVAEAKAGDSLGASRTFSTALDLANRAENASLKRFTLPRIAAGQAEAGLDSDLRVTLGLIEPSETVGTYKVVALIYAKQGMIKEAKGYFSEAIKHAREIKDSSSRDSNLMNISESQADAGLIDDAKATARMIGLDGYQKSALEHISLIEEGVIKRQTP
jgi:tetratricopeptide (TPR) repeat protein